MPASGYAIYRGITTGLNDAFIIDNDTRDALVSQDPKSAELLQRVLRGKNIERWQAAWKGEWVIVAKFGIFETLPKSYPAIYQHLCQYEARLKARGQCRYSRSQAEASASSYPGQHHWLELDNNPKDSYLQLFSRPKLLWIELVERGRFAFDNSNAFAEATTFMLTGENLMFLCGMLNSRLMHWHLSQIAPTSGTGTLRWKKIYVERLPVPKLTTEKQHPLVQLVDRILSGGAAGEETEQKIDQLVYELYGLTPLEISAIEQSVT